MIEEELQGPLFASAAGRDAVPTMASRPTPGLLEGTGDEGPMDQESLHRYLRLTGLTIQPRTWKNRIPGEGAPAWVETLSNGRPLVCERGLRWHLAKTQAEAKRLVEAIRIQSVSPATTTTASMEDQAALFRANPTEGTLGLRAILAEMGLACQEEVVIGWRIADFLVEERLVVEVDGIIRRSRKSQMDDRVRDEELLKRGFLVLRLPEDAVLGTPEAVIRQLGMLMDDLALSGGEKPVLTPPPAPAGPQGRQIIVFTDGGCSPNPGAGGYGAILSCEGRRREVSGGFARTTNNRMEIYAAIAGLEALQRPGCQVTIFSDSRYLVDAIEKGWARKWRRNGWMRTPDERAKNVDLWERLLALLDKHKVHFEWVKGHAGHPENERCDQLAGAALAQKDLPEDRGFLAEEAAKEKSINNKEIL